MNNPLCLIISGPSGSGKSTVSRLLWEKLENNPAYLSLDSIKHFVYGAESTDYFLDLARIQAESLTRNYLLSGHSVILEKAFGDYRYVKPFIQICEELNIPNFYFKLIAPLNILIQRVDRRKNYSIEEKIEAGEWPFPIGNKKTATEIYNFSKKNTHEEGIEIDTSKRSPKEILKLILNNIQRNS